MKPLTALVAVALALSHPVAGHAQAGDEYKALICPKWEALAVQIMTNRQYGASMSEMMAANDGPDGVEDPASVNDGMVREAFKVPRFSTPSVRQDAITDFGNKMAALCWNS